MITQVSTEGEASQVLNPAYQVWLQQDQLVLSFVLSPLSSEMLVQVLFMTIAAEVWSALEHMCASQSRAQTMQIRMEISNARKKDLTAAEYFGKMKSLADTMAAAVVLSMMKN